MHSKQIERLVNKMKQLTNVYQKYIIVERINIPNVLLNAKPIKSGTLWGSDFEYGLFSFTLDNINLLNNKDYYIYCETGATEHLISLNGKKIGMLDYVKDANDPLGRIHKYTYLGKLKKDDVIEVEAYYSHKFAGTFPYHKESTYALNSLDNHRPFERIELVTFDENLKKLVLDMQMINELYDTSFSAQKAFLVHLYEELFKILSLKDEKPTEESITLALEITKDFREKYNEVKPYVGIIGHSHLDTAWLWTIEETKHKLLRTISNAVQLLKQYPEYKFFLSTVYYLEYIKQVDNNLYQDIIHLIKEGRLEPNGGSYIEFDSNLIGNEALCRQFLKGQQFLQKEAGYKCNTFWLPDTFGYAASLPQVLKLSGIKYFLTTKLSWNDTNTFPYDTFKWIGIDGSSVNAHFNTIHCWVDPKTVKNRVNNVIDKNTTTDTLIAYGFGDGGGGPSKEMVERAIDTCHTSNDIMVEHTTVSDFMDRISHKVLPSYYGELYLELHRGTFTSIHDIKKYHAELSVLLHDLDLVNILSNIKTNNNLKTVIDNYYDLLMLNEFHDILPGTCINEVNTKSINDLKKACAAIKENYFNDGNYYNPTCFERVDKINNQLYLSSPFSYSKEIATDKTINYENNIIKTNNFTVELKNGQITKLLFNNKNLVNSFFGVLKYSENIPFIYDNWDIDADYKLKEQPCKLIDIQEKIKNDKEYIISTYYQIKDSTIQCDLIINADLDYIDYQYTLDIKNDHLLIRSYFDTTIFSDHYTSDIQFGNLKRNTLSSGHEDEAKFETCSHKWVDLSNNSYGLSLLKKDLYGTSCDGNVLGITLHKGGTHPDNIHELGIHQVSIGLLPHLGNLSMETINAGYVYNYPLIKTNQPINSLFNIISNNNIVIETIKQGEDGGIIIRMYEAMGADSQITLKFNQEYDLSIVNILEEVLENLGIHDMLTLEFKPFEIKTILLK